VRSIVAAVRSEQITFLAASLAYYAFVSVMPLLLLLVVVATAVGGEELTTTLVSRLGDVLTPSGQDLLQESLTSANGRGGATILGLSLLFWSGLKVFRGLDVAFSKVYGTDVAGGFLGQLRDAAIALLAVGAGITVAIAASVLIGLSGLPYVNLLGPPALATALTITFLPLYVILPDAKVGVTEAIPGAVVAAGGWTLLGTGFRVYAAAAGTTVYGVIGGVILLLTWFYIGGIVLLLGGVVNAVLAGKEPSVDRNRQLQQERPRGAVQRPSMTDEHDGVTEPREDVDEELAELRAQLEEFEDEIEDRTVHRDDLERDLKRYVRRRVRRGHATGWGPYLVLLYGTVMTMGAFYFLGGGWAILAMLVIWLSTLGLYVLMVLVGVTVTAAGLPGKLRDVVSSLR